jgi:hypothetical protein
MLRFSVAALVVASITLGGAVQAAAKPDPSGSWTWNAGGRQPVKVQLKLDGEQLTGTMIGRDGSILKVEDGTYIDGKVSFKVASKTPQGKAITLKFSGKLKGDAIEGTGEVNIEGSQPRTGPWRAKRSKE